MLVGRSTTLSCNRMCTRAFNWTPTSSLLSEVVVNTWSSMKILCLLQFYRMRSCLTPNYLEITLPPKTVHYSTYSVRHSNNYLSIQTQKFQNSFDIGMNWKKMQRNLTAWMLLKCSWRINCFQAECSMSVKKNHPSSTHEWD